MRGKQTNVKPKTLDIFFFPLSLCLLDNENEHQKNSAQRTKKKNAHVGDMHSQTVTQISPASAWCNHQRKHQRAMLKNATHCPSLSSSSSRLHRQTSIRASSSSDSPDGYDEDGEKLVVPPNLFPGFETPEKKAASSLVTLMTMAACRVVLDQWCGSRHRSPMYNKLIDYMQKGAPHTNNEPRPIRDGNQWLHELMRHPELDFRLAAVRILETRKLLVDKEFNWEVMDANAREGIRAESIELNKLYLNMLCAEKDECEDVSYEEE
jgi:hypothetical protein